MKNQTQTVPQSLTRIWWRTSWPISVASFAIASILYAIPTLRHLSAIGFSATIGYPAFAWPLVHLALGKDLVVQGRTFKASAVLGDTRKLQLWTLVLAASAMQVLFLAVPVQTGSEFSTTQLALAFFLQPLGIWFALQAYDAIAKRVSAQQA